MKAYIYMIKNIVTGKIYIGSTKSPTKRKYSHFQQLRNNKHVSSYLQYSYNKHGKSSFIFEVIEECSPEERKQKELNYINHYKSHIKLYGYNVYEPNGDAFQCSESTKQKIIDTQVRLGQSKPIDVYNVKDLSYFGTFTSVKQFCRKYKMFQQPVYQVLQDKRKSYKGYTFVYKNEPLFYLPSNKQRNMTSFYKSAA